MTAHSPRMGRVEGALMKVFTKPAEVTAVEQLTVHFRLLTLGGVRVLLEATSKDELKRVLTRMELDAEVVERRAGDAHLAELEARAEEWGRREAVTGFVLGGKASSI